MGIHPFCTQGQRMGSSLFCVQNPSRLTSRFRFPPGKDVGRGMDGGVYSSAAWLLLKRVDALMGGGRKKPLWREWRTSVPPREGQANTKPGEHQGLPRIFLPRLKITSAPQQSAKDQFHPAFFSNFSHAGSPALSYQMHF